MVEGKISREATQNNIEIHTKAIRRNNVNWIHPHSNRVLKGDCTGHGNELSGFHRMQWIMTHFSNHGVIKDEFMPSGQRLWFCVQPS